VLYAVDRCLFVHQSVMRLSYCLKIALFLYYPHPVLEMIYCKFCNNE